MHREVRNRIAENEKVVVVLDDQIHDNGEEGAQKVPTDVDLMVRKDQSKKNVHLVLVQRKDMSRSTFF